MAANIIIVHMVNNNDNFDDLLTNSLPGWKRVQLISRIMHSDNPNIPRESIYTNPMNLPWVEWRNIYVRDVIIISRFSEN